MQTRCQGYLYQPQLATDLLLARTRATTQFLLLFASPIKSNLITICPYPSQIIPLCILILFSSTHCGLVPLHPLPLHRLPLVPVEKA